jgi:hypothetical protein
VCAFGQRHGDLDYPFTPDTLAGILATQLADVATLAGPLPGVLDVNTRRLFPALADRC